MTPHDIHRLGLAAQRAGIAELVLDGDGASLRLSMGRVERAVVRTDMARAAPDGPGQIRAPAVGIFRTAHPATGRVPVQPGEAVAGGQLVGYLQSGSVLRPVLATQPGTLGAPLVADGSVVGYGTPLYALT